MPTINALFSHQVSVIMGDFLYSRAVVELVRAGNLDALRILSRVTTEMTVGEMRQLLADDPLAFGEPEYDLLIKAKTASLMSGACEVGALEAPPEQRRALASFGEKLGMIFQITDDLLDYTADETTTGQAVGARPARAQGDAAADLRDPPALDRGTRRARGADARSDAERRRDRERRGLRASARRTRLRPRPRPAPILEAEEELALLPDTPARDILRASLGYVLERRR